jgi:ribonuclease R
LAEKREVLGTLLSVGKRFVLIPELKIPGLSGGFFVAKNIRVEAEWADQLAVGEIAAFDPATERPEVGRLTLLGPPDMPKPAMERRIASEGWPRHFSERALQEASAQVEPLASRLDLSELMILSIDPHDAKDHDDAVSLEVLAAGKVRLGVHIADVASRVPAHGTLDHEARARATSVYPPGQVLPMLPECLSSDACSLHHGVARDALSVFLEYDAHAQRTGISLGPSIIKSRASLSYRQAQALLDGDGSSPPPERLAPEVRPEQLQVSLRNMLALAQKLRAKREENGSLFVERPEYEVEFEDSGHVAALRERTPLSTHWIIEEFMLEANRAVAETLHAAHLPLLWRVHEDPDEMKVSDLVATLKGLGVDWVPDEPVAGKDYQELFRRVKGSRLESLVSLLALRSLMRASYRRGRGKHFGLAFESYTHFTSPIRRYPDLQNQRWLHVLVERKGGWLKQALHDASSLAGESLADAADWEETLLLADHCSQQERRATLIERDCRDICAADWLADRIGEKWEGVITGVVRSGLFVELDGCGMDGFVGLAELSGDWYTYDEKRNCLLGERSGKRYGLGQPVQVLLSHVDVATGRLWLRDLQKVPAR